MLRRFTYSRSRDYASLFADDALLGMVFVALLLFGAEGPLGALAVALRVAIPLVLAWGIITLHFPTCIEIGDAHITFGRYGRQHRFERDRIDTISVRRFLVRDRVLVRIVPAPPWRGRYWLLSGLADFEELIAILNTARSSNSKQE